MNHSARRTLPAHAPYGGSFSRGYAAVFASVILWSLPSLFQFYLLRYYDIWAQNFYRYSVAFIAIAPLVLLRVRRGDPPLYLRAFGLCLLPALPNVVHQVTQTLAFFTSVLASMPFLLAHL
jgi:drug/metabolite transporter (DMT)-like permease